MDYLFLVLFAAVIALIYIRPRGIHPGIIALIGAVISIIAGFVSFNEVANVMLFSPAEPVKVIVFFISFVIVSLALEDVGFFRWSAYHAARLARNDGMRLFNISSSLWRWSRSSPRMT